MASNNESVNKQVKILVFGTTSVGKTSLINLLTNNKFRVNQGNARGTTFKPEHIPFVRENNTRYIITDTIGLNEADGGTVKAADAVLNLIELIEDAKAGYNLIIYVRKCEPITRTDIKNYEVFIDALFDKKLNSIVVNTHAENFATDGVTMNMWWKKNSELFRQNKLEFNGGISACVVSSCGNPMFDETYSRYSEQSKKEIWDLIDRHKSDVLIVNSNGIKAILAKIWNKFVDFMSNIPLLSRTVGVIANQRLEQTLKELGVPAGKSQEIARRHAEN